MPDGDRFGISEASLRKLIKEAPDEYILQQWLRDYVSRGLITKEQATGIFEYIQYSWDKIAEQQEVTRRETGLTMARREAQERARVRTAQPRYVTKTRPTPSMPKAGPIYYPFLEGMSPAMKRYFEPRLGQIYGEFEREKPGARAEWWSALHPEKTSKHELGDPLAHFVGERPTERAEGAGRRPAPGGEGFIEGPEGGYTDVEMARARAQKMEDPWKAYMGKYPFLQKFYGMSPERRGFFPSTFRPITRWLNF